MWKGGANAEITQPAGFGSDIWAFRANPDRAAVRVMVFVSRPLWQGCAHANLQMGGNGMSVSVSDLLGLPSLRAARVAAGHQGLGNMVSAISVLEAVDIGTLQSLAMAEAPYSGSELILTGFLNAKNSIDAQCASLRHLASIGAAGVVVYYVGIDIPYIDEKLINLANQIDFPLIIMPENRPDLRYSDVISEVMEIIIRDRSNSASLLGDIFEQISRLAEHQRSVDTLLRILRDRFHISLVLIDNTRRVLNAAAWPSSDDDAVKALLEDAFYDGAKVVQTERGVFIYRKTIELQETAPLQLIIIKREDQLDAQTLMQIFEVVKLFIEIYNNRHGKVVISELVRAIMQDEPLKMRRLAEYFNLNVEAIDTLWVLSAVGEDSVRLFAPSVPIIKELVGTGSSAQIIDVFENCLLILFDRPFRYADYRELAERVLAVFPQEAVVYMSQHTSCANPGDIRKGFLEHKWLIEDMKKIFPTWRIFQDSEFLFVSQCRAYVDAGAETINHYTGLLEPILNYPKNEDLLETLTTYLLDATSSIQETSDLMFLHRSTVKYRMSNISNILGFRPDMMPSSLPLYYAVAIKRLLE